QPDFVFLATPPEVSRDWVAGLHAAGSRARVVDLSGAYRFDPEVVYGWPERNAAAIATAKLVSNPGCYATAANLALGPLIQAGVIAPEEIVCDAKSGASGAGKGPRPRSRGTRAWMRPRSPSRRICSRPAGESWPRCTFDPQRTQPGSRPLTSAPTPARRSFACGAASCRRWGRWRTPISATWDGNCAPTASRR